METHQLERLISAADELASGLDELCNAINRECDDFQPVYQRVVSATDMIANYRSDRQQAA